MNINVKVYGGVRKPIEVRVEPTGVNTKIIKFKNGKTVTDNAIAEFIQNLVYEMLNNVASS